MSEAKLNICEPCEENRHFFCQFTVGGSLCQCPKCVHLNHRLNKQVLKDKTEKITGVRP